MDVTAEGLICAQRPPHTNPVGLGALDFFIPLLDSVLLQ